MQWLTVKNWAEFQHYADRNPTWIKLHRALLDDYEFCALPDHAKGHLVLIWIFASQQGGRVPADPQFLKKKLGLNRDVDLSQLVTAGFLIADPAQDASEPLALEEKRREQKPKSRRLTLPPDFAISESVREWARTGGYDQIEASFTHFCDYAKANGRIYADWDAALRNCIKGDWGDARKKARDRVRVGGAPRAVAPDCNVPGCKREGLPALGGKCEVHHVQSRPAGAVKQIGALLPTRAA